MNEALLQKFNKTANLLLTMKGQYITLENVLFFAVGIFMIITVYAIFSGISDSIRSTVVDNQLAKEGENIRTSMMKVFIAGNSTNSTIRFSLDVPRQLSGCYYKIVIKENKLHVSCIDDTFPRILNLYGIETKIKDGVAYSSSAKINMYYADGSILLS